MSFGKSLLRSALGIFFLTVYLQNLGAQTDFNIRLWQSEDGLPNNIIQAIAQTRDGYLWVGTREGLARFDGVQFQAREILPQTAQPSVVSLLSSRDGSLWIGTENFGIFRWWQGQLTRCQLKGGDNNFTVDQILEDSAGTIWFGTSRGIIGWSQREMELKKGFKNPSPRLCTDNAGQIWVLDNTLKPADSNAATNYPAYSHALPDRARSLYCDSAGAFWMGADIGSPNVLIEAKAGVVTSFNRNVGPTGFVSVIFRDSAGELWIGSYAGLSRLINGRFVNFRTSDTASYRIYSIFEDREQNLWIGSEEGLTELTAKRFKTITKKEGLAMNAVVSVCPSQDGGVWISSWGGGVNHYLNGNITHLNTTNGLKSDYILGLTEARDGSLWVGADYGGPLQCIKDGHILTYDRDQGFHPGSATAVLCEDDNGRLWIGDRDDLQTWDGTHFTRYTTKEGLCNDTIHAICRGSNGAMWIGTAGGLMQWRAGHFQNMADIDSRLRVSILSLYQDAQNTLWIGTKLHGLLMLRNGVVTEITSQQGLFSDAIFATLEDNHTNLWLNSSRGIFRVNKQQAEEMTDGDANRITSISYGKADGIVASGQFRDVTQPAACKDAQGHLWFRTTQGVVMVDPDTLAMDHQPPPVVIQKITADNQPMRIAQSNSGTPAVITIPPGRGELEIQYAALSYTAPEKNMYRYQLSGVDSDWVNAGNLNVTKYNNLRPGHYRFQVIARNDDGVWNEKGQTIELILEPHFWQTWWFFTLCGLSAMGIVGAAARYEMHRRMQRTLMRLEQQRAVEQERIRIARDVHDELGSKLTRISFQGGIAVCHLNDPVETKRQIEQMSAAAREAVSSLHEIIWSADPENDSLEGLVGHISHYAGEFFSASAISCEVLAAEPLPTRRISAAVRHNLFLAVKEAINNAAKHANATKVLIQFSLSATELEILISDNGNGFETAPAEVIEPHKSKRAGYGLVNMRARLNAIGGRCEIRSDSQSGTAIRFFLPLASHEN